MIALRDPAFVNERRGRRVPAPDAAGAAIEAIAAQGLAVTVVKEGTLPRSLKMFGAAEGLPSLPTAEIRLHCATEAAAPTRLLVDHLRERLGTGRRRARGGGPSPA